MREPIKELFVCFDCPFGPVYLSNSVSVHDVDLHLQGDRGFNFASCVLFHTAVCSASYLINVL